MIGQQEGVRAAIDAQAGRAPSLSRNDVYRRATDDLADGRVADVYASPDGVSRLLAAQAELLGAAGALLDQPALQGTAMSLSPRSDGLALRVHSVLDPRLARQVPRRQAVRAQAGLLGARERDGLPRPDPARPRGRAAARRRPGGRRAWPVFHLLLARAQRDLDRRAGVNLRRDVLPLLQGEVALWLAPAIPAPILTLIASTDDEDRHPGGVRALQGPIARLLGQPGSDQVASFREREVDGAQVFQLLLGPGIDARLRRARRQARGLDLARRRARAVKKRDGTLEDNGSFDATLGARPDRVTR